MTIELRSGLWALLPLIAAVVAGGQFACSQYLHLTPWKGGGFGMFASTDSPSARYVSIVGFDDSGVSSIVRVPFGRFGQTPALSSGHLVRLKAMPDVEKMSALGDAVLRADLVPGRTRGALAPTRLQRFLNDSQLFNGFEAMPTLELVGVFRQRTSVRLRKVRVSVLRLEMDSQRGASLVEVLPPVERESSGAAK